MSLTLTPFDDTMLADAGRLLALRHRRLREARPELPAAYEDPEAASRAVEAAWRREGAAGAAAYRDGRMLGYLIGDPVIDNLWGRSGWVRFGGCALAADQDPELARDLYAMVGARWVAAGCFTHFALVPASDDALLGRWFALCFGIEHVHALLSLETLDLPRPPELPEVEIRRAAPQDRADLEALSDVIWRHQVQAPVWGIHLPEREALHRREYGDLSTNTEIAVWLAFYRGRAVGIQGYYPIEFSPESPYVPERCVHLCAAGTREDVRGKGIGRALTWHVLQHARSAGYATCETDWRSTNLLSSRFWPRQGFRPVIYRLARRVDPRIAWANGSAAL